MKHRRVNPKEAQHEGARGAFPKNAGMNMQRTWQSWVWLVATRAIFIYAAAVFLLTLLQRHLIYMPSRGREEDLIRQAENEGLRPWRGQGEELVGWRTELRGDAPFPRNRLVVFHGNAGYAQHRTYYVDGFLGIPQGSSTWEVFLFEYPGYGAREGTRNEENLAAAARRALEALRVENSRPVYLLGESLGSSFASRLAAAEPQSVHGLFLVTPMTCLADVAASHYPFAPVRWMLRERHDVRGNLRAYPGPVAFLVAGRDEVMKDSLGKKLFESYAGRKKLWLQPQAGHNTLDLSMGIPLWREVSAFLDQK
jgi:hypothetical protein